MFLAQDSGFNIQKETHFKNNITDFRKSKYVSKKPITKLLFQTKISTLLHKSFSRKFLNCGSYTFDRLEIRILTPNRLKIKSVTHSNYLATIATINKDFLNKIVAFHIALLL